MIPSPSSGASTESSGVTALPPMPPLLSYQKTVESANKSVNKYSGLSLHTSSVPGVFGSGSTNSTHSNGNHSNNHTRSGSYSSPAKTEAFSPTDPSAPSWLTALGNSGHKRPPPAHSNNLPPAKRIHLEKTSDSPASSNSNDSQLVDYDSLCNLLDADRNEEMNSVLGFPADFPLSGPISSSSQSRSRNIFNMSPSEIISLD